MTIYEKINYLIDRKGITRKFLCSEIGVPYNTLNSMFKRNSGSISVDTIRDMAKYFEVSIDYLMDDEITDPEYGKTVDMALTLPEQTHIKKYRDLDGHGKETVGVVLEKEHERYIELKRAQEEQAAAREKQINSPADDEPQTVEMKVYEQPAAAGIGNYLTDSDDYDIISFPANEVPSNADFGVRISGDSMEPKISDGDIVWVKAMPQIEDGEIGIFILDGDALCKKLHIDYKKKAVELISLNSKYKPRKIGEYEELRTVGKVLQRWVKL